MKNTELELYRRDFPVEFKTLLNNTMGAKAYSPPIETDPNNINSALTVILLVTLDANPLAGHFTIASLIRGTNSCMYLGNNQKVDFSDIGEDTDFVYDVNNPGKRFSVTYQSVTPYRVSGFVCQNNLNVNVIGIEYAIIPVISLVREV